MFHYLHIRMLRRRGRVSHPVIPSSSIHNPANPSRLGDACLACSAIRHIPPVSATPANACAFAYPPFSAKPANACAFANPPNKKDARGVLLKALRGGINRSIFPCPRNTCYGGYIFEYKRYRKSHLRGAYVIYNLPALSFKNLFRRSDVIYTTQAYDELIVLAHIRSAELASGFCLCDFKLSVFAGNENLFARFKIHLLSHIGGQHDPPKLVNCSFRCKFHILCLPFQ